MADLSGVPITAVESAADAQEAPILRVVGLVKDYRAVHAVRGINLELRRGEILGFLGPNGAGKSTTIRCLLDLLRPTAGRIEIFGKNPRSQGPEIRSRMAYVPGELRLPERLTGTQLVDSIAGLRGRFDPGRRDLLAERLNLDLSRPTRHLSSGNRHKVSLLLAFLWPAELLVLDEPTTGLDPLMQHEFLAMLREAREGGASVFLSSHVLSEVQRVADRVVVLGSGQIVAQGTVEELRGRSRLRVEVWFEGSVPPTMLQVPGLVGAEVSDRRFSASLVGPIMPLLQYLGKQRVVGMLIEEPDLEEAFLDLYTAQA